MSFSRKGRRTFGGALLPPPLVPLDPVVPIQPLPGEYVFVRDPAVYKADTTSRRALLAHEYIHVLQWEAAGTEFAAKYFAGILDTGPSNPLEAPGYLWQGYVRAFYPYANSGMRRLPWDVWLPL